ncbi:alkaline-phosphatase-like protein [Pelagophyceae sp. CCMP2097]|nr:alkaline-phosphatase-like protein [Pelagophyceae sp. CCMP2097]
MPCGRGPRGAWLLLLLASARAALPGALPRPDIVLWTADDVGYGDLGCYGSPVAQTPHLDALAREGIRFEQAYAASTICTPSRAGQMTGLYPGRLGFEPEDFGLAAGLPTVASTLRSVGYATAHFGKWDLIDCNASRLRAGPPAKTPSRHHFIGLEGVLPHDYGFNRIKRARLEGPVMSKVLQYIQTATRRRVDGTAPTPIYLSLAGHVAHFPVEPPGKYLARFGLANSTTTASSPSLVAKMPRAWMASTAAAAKQAGCLDVEAGLRRYVANLAFLDDRVGEVRGAVAGNAERSDNTLIIFTSDHGPSLAPVEFAIHGQAACALLGSAGPDLRGAKHSFLEGGVRVPLIAHWPAAHAALARRVDGDTVVSGLDFLPTFVALARAASDAPDADSGFVVRADRFDGLDRSAALAGKFGGGPTGKPLLWTQQLGHDSRACTRNAGVSFARLGRFKCHNCAGAGARLYDIVADPGEARDLARAMPAQMAALAATVLALHATFPTEVTLCRRRKCADAEVPRRLACSAKACSGLPGCVPRKRSDRKKADRGIATRRTVRRSDPADVRRGPE